QVRSASRIIGPPAYDTASGGAAVTTARGFGSGLALAETGLERAHETAHLRLTLDPGRADRLARRLALDDVQEDRAVGVLVALGVPVGGERLDQAQGQLELAAIARGRGRGQAEARRRAELVGPPQRREHERLPRRLQRGQVLALAQHDGADAHAPALGERVAQQRVRLGCGRARRRYVVGLGEVEVVDRGARHEVADLEGLRPGHARLLEVLIGHDDVAILGQRVALDDLGPGHLDPFLVAHALVVDRALVPGVQLAERQLVFPLGGGMQRDGHRHEPERDRPLPHRAGPGAFVVVSVLPRARLRRHTASLIILSSNGDASYTRMSADWIRFTPAPLMSAHALPSDPPASMPRVASSTTSASKPALRASSADHPTQKSVASPTRNTRVSPRSFR